MNVDGVVYGVRRLGRVMPKGSTIVVTASLAAAMMVWTANAWITIGVSALWGKLQ